MAIGIELIKFLNVDYEPDDPTLPGYLSIGCLIRDRGTRELTRGYTFQFQEWNRKLYFVVYPTAVQYPVGDASTLEEAITQARQFLVKWLGDDVQYQLKTHAEIRRLEEMQETKKYDAK